MAISDKILYLNDTKKLLKQEINKSTEITDEDTFRSYAPKIYDGYLGILNNGTDTLWNNLEKVSQTGTEAVLEGVETAPIKMVLNGNTSQETTTGKNLLKLENAITDNGISATINEDGSISYSGTATNAYSVITSYIENEIPIGNYIFTRDKAINYITRIQVEYEDSTTNYFGIGAGYVAALINVEKKIVKYRIRLHGLTAGETYNDTLYLQLEQGSTATSWEKYTGGQPSPSPDYPQQVKVVKGENVVSVQGKNLLPYTIQTINETKTGVTFTGENGIYTISGVPTTNTRSSNYQLVNEYTIKDGDYVHFLNDKSYGVVTFGFLFTDNTSLSPAQGPINRIYKFADAYIGKTIKQIYMYVTTAYDGEKITIKPMILNNISTYTDFVPYSKTDYPISLGTLELCKINTYKDYFHKDSGKWYVHKEIGKAILDGSESWSRSGTRQSTEYFRFRTSALRDLVLAPSSSGVLMSAYCDLFVIQTADDTYKRIEGISAISNGQMDIYYEPLKEYTAPEFKTWLSNNNVTLYYVLATPTETEITNTTLIEQLEEISKAKSVKDKTYITQTNYELPFILDVEAIREYEENLDNN